MLHFYSVAYKLTIWDKIDAQNRFSIVIHPYFDMQHSSMLADIKFYLFSPIYTRTKKGVACNSKSKGPRTLEPLPNYLIISIISKSNRLR